MDRIILQGLGVDSLIGVYPWEREKPTSLLVDVTLWLDLQPASHSDQVSDTLDYAAIAELLEEVARISRFELLEALAGAMIKALFAQFNCHQIELALSKPGILANAKNVAVVLNRTRE